MSSEHDLRDRIGECFSSSFIENKDATAPEHQENLTLLI